MKMNLSPKLSSILLNKSFALILFNVLICNNNIYPEKLIVRNIKVVSGESNYGIRSIEMDSIGYLWLGTSSGLVRYDGYNFIVYKNELTRLKTGLNNRVYCVHNDGDKIWLATNRGISCFDSKKEQFIPLDDFKEISQITDEINYIFVDHKKNIWYSSINYFGVLSPISANEYRSITSNEMNLPFKNESICLLSIREDENKGVWAASSRGILYFNNNLDNFRSDSIIYTHSDIYQYPYNAFCIDKSKLVAFHNDVFMKLDYKIDSASKKVIVYDDDVINLKKELTKIKLREGFTYRDIYCDRNGKIWAVTNNGLYCLDNVYNDNPLKLTSCSTSNGFINSLSDKNIKTSYWKNDLLFLGYTHYGLDVVDVRKKPFKKLINSNINDIDILKCNVLCIEIDKRSNIWLGTEKNGLLYFNNQTRIIDKIPWEPEYNQSDINVRDIQLDKYGNVWLATNHGLRCYKAKDKKMEFFIKSENDDRLSHNRLVSLAYDGNSNLWAATRFKGITRIKLTGESSEPEFEKIEQADSSLHSIQFDRNICLFYDSLQNELWSGSYHGLDRLLLNDKGDIKKVLHYAPEFDNPEKIQGNQVRAIQKSGNYLWLAVNDFGVYKMLPSEYHDSYGFADYTAISYSKKDGLYSNNVDNLLIDDKARIWIGENGLSLFETTINHFYHFDYSDGLHSDIFKKNSSAIDKDGNIYIGGIGGITFFDPDSVNVNTKISETYITDIEINNERWVPFENKNIISSAGFMTSITHLDLQKKQNHLKIYFSTFDYAGANRARYKYRLLGLDNEWFITELGENHVAYSYLKPGKYKFQVQSQQNTYANSNHITEFTVKVWRPWWSSILMIVLYILVFISTIAIIVRLLYYNQKYKHELEIDRVSQKKQSEVSEEKMKFYTSISHELRTPLTLLIEPVSAIIKSDYKPETTKFFIDVIDKNARRLLKLVDELMDYKKIESDVIQLNTELVEIVAFTREIMESFQVEALRQNIRLSYYPEFNKKEIPLDKDKYYKILNNLIANAINNIENKGTVKIFLTSSPYENDQFRNNYEIISEDKPLNEFIAVQVEDSGKGISKKSLQHIFDKNHYDLYHKKINHEQNIGLDLIKSLASVHKADVFISSTKNIGSCFSVHFPLNIALKHKKITTIDIGKDVKIEVSDSYKTFRNLFKIYRRDNPKILIVDDNKDIRLLLSVSLQPYYTIIEAKNGEEAYRMAIKELPDLILSDIMMPEMNGIELCQKIKNDFFTSHIPVVLISARASEEHKMEGVSTGADLYLTKPFNMEMVKAHVVSILSNRLAVQMKFKNSTKTPPLELVNTSVDESFMEKLIDIIVANISNTNYSVDLLAKDYGITRIGLFNKLKALTGQSPSEFIRSVKLNRAAELLRSNKYSSSEVSFMTGFATPSYFSKRFREKFGVTPSEFVKDNTITFDN